MTLDHTIRQAYIDTLLDGGYTRLADKTINPIEGYIVGGVTEPTTMDLHTDSHSHILDMYQKFKELWHKYDMQLYECVAPNIGVGTWIHEGKIYFDLVQHFHGLDRATEQAKQRGEIAISQRRRTHRGGREQ